MTAKIVQLSFPFSLQSPPPKRPARDYTNWNDRPSRRRGISPDADLIDMAQYFIEAHLRAMDTRAVAGKTKLHAVDNDGRRKVSYEPQE